MPRARIETIQPPHFAPPRGYANGVAASGRTLYVAGQVGWEHDGTFASDDIGEQFARALDHVIDVVEEAGGAASDVVRMTVYVTDLEGYRRARAKIGAAWRERFGRHYPAMALIGVAGLLEPRAKVEIEAVASLPDL